LSPVKSDRTFQLFSASGRFGIKIANQRATLDNPRSGEPVTNLEEFPDVSPRLFPEAAERRELPWENCAKRIQLQRSCGRQLDPQVFPLLANELPVHYSIPMKSLDSIASEALLLPKDQRLTLAHRILTSVEVDAEPGADAAGDDEIRERIRKYDAGQTTPIPGSDVFDALDKRLAR